MLIIFAQTSTLKITRSVGLLCIFIFLTGLSFLKTQTVPDKNFASAIRDYNCPSCIFINGDGTGTLIQPAAGNLTALNVSSKNISDLTGLSGFTGLTDFRCDQNLITTMPTLPTGLTFFSCGANQLSSLPTLPTGLSVLYCYQNLLTALPAFPTSLAFLSCPANQITIMPPLPTGMGTVYCQNNQITSLPILPTGLQNLHFDTTKIHCITYSGMGLQLFDANGTYLGLGEKYPKCAALPVEMTEFTAKPGNDRTVHLLWQTASERNNDRFDIERSTDGQLYTLIGQIKGNGTTQVSHDYQFMDDKISFAGIYYYRLNQIDNDGTSKISPIVSVEIADAEVRVYPTVFKDRIRILSANSALPVTVTDIIGRVIREYATTPESIEVSDLGVGMYIVRVGNETVRVVKTDR